MPAKTHLDTGARWVTEAQPRVISRLLCPHSKHTELGVQDEHIISEQVKQ